jgi:hypothetical protein
MYESENCPPSGFLLKVTRCTSCTAPRTSSVTSTLAVPLGVRRVELASM